MSWYDWFSFLYDVSIEHIYLPYRERMIGLLNKGEGSVVLDLACGTGQNFALLTKHVGSEGQVFGVDASHSMLKVAKRRIERSSWENVTLLQRDARELSLADLEALTQGPVALDAVVCTLGMTVLPDWEEIFSTTFEMLKPGGQYLIFDVHAEQWVPQTTWVQWIAQADLSRPVWRPLANASHDFSVEFLPGSPHVHGGQPVLAVGSKP